MLKTRIGRKHRTCSNLYFEGYEIESADVSEIFRPSAITAVPLLRSSGENAKFYVTSFTFLGNLFLFSEKLQRRGFSLDSVFDTAFSERFHWESFTNFRVASGT